MERYARKDSVTGKGINYGFVFEDLDFYCQSELDALDKCEELGYNTMEEAYEEGVYYWTTWQEVDDDLWYDEDGSAHIEDYENL